MLCGREAAAGALRRTFSEPSGRSSACSRCPPPAHRPKATRRESTPPPTSPTEAPPPPTRPPSATLRSRPFPRWQRRRFAPRRAPPPQTTPPPPRPTPPPPPLKPPPSPRPPPPPQTTPRPSLPSASSTSTTLSSRRGAEAASRGTRTGQRQPRDRRERGERPARSRRGTRAGHGSTRGPLVSERSCKSCDARRTPATAVGAATRGGPRARQRRGGGVRFPLVPPRHGLARQRVLASPPFRRTAAALRSRGRARVGGDSALARGGGRGARRRRVRRGGRRRSLLVAVVALQRAQPHGCGPEGVLRPVLARRHRRGCASLPRGADP
mmetsp:Transcript_25188/g.83842  ORF Transcript_25188/g.83842 Transcript_25188/m.83842 type:complete len:325 (-) Transcript_25188:84-1058(-)